MNAKDIAPCLDCEIPRLPNELDNGICAESVGCMEYGQVWACEYCREFYELAELNWNYRASAYYCYDCRQDLPRTDFI